MNFCGKLSGLADFENTVDRGSAVMFDAFSDVVVVSDLNKNFGGSTDLAKKRHGLADWHTLFTPLSTRTST